MHGFSQPNDWAGFRNIDEEVNLDSLNFGVDDIDGDESDDLNGPPKKTEEKND